MYYCFLNNVFGFHLTRKYNSYFKTLKVLYTPNRARIHERRCRFDKARTRFGIAYIPRT